MKAEATLPLVLARPEHDVAAMQAEIVADFEQLAAVIEDYTRPEEANTSAMIFHNLRWMRAWWRGFGNRVEVFAPVVFQGNAVVGILPLVRQGTSIRFLGMPGADYGDILCRPAIAPEVTAAALRTLLHLEGWNTCRLDHLRDNSEIVRCAMHLPADIRSHLNLLRMARRSALVLREGRDAVIAATLRKPTLRRHRNKLYRTGEVRFRHLELRDDVHRLLPTLFQQHIARRAVAGESSQFLGPEWRNFYAALVDELDLRGQLRFSVLELDGRPIACHFGFECNGTLIVYKPTFDVDYWDLSPGDVLLSELLAYARDRALDEVDFTIGAEAYKEHFTNESHDMFCLTLDRGVVTAGLRRLIEPAAVHFNNYPIVRKMKAGFANGMRQVAAKRRRGRLTVSRWTRQTSLAYVREPSVATCAPRLASSAVPLLLNDLAKFAVQKPRLFDADLLREFRVRLRSGDHCFLWSGPAAQQIGWTRRITLPSSIAPGSTQRKADVLYEFWPVSGPPDGPICHEFVQWFAGHAQAEGVLACICAPKRDAASRGPIEAAGFRCQALWHPLLEKLPWHI
jgi:CelD/BcsL family acetyltransferase involved in cellulose biosynthesis